MDEKPWLSHYDKGVPYSLAPYPSKPLFSFLEESAAKFPDRPCTVFQGRVITYREMNDLTDRMAAGLASIGVKPATGLGCSCPTSRSLSSPSTASSRPAAWSWPPTRNTPPREIVHQLMDSGIELMVVMSKFYKIIKDVQSQTKLKTLIVTNVKEQLPPLTALLAFTLMKEQQDGHRVTLAPGDLWMKDLVDKHTAAERPKLNISADDMALLQYSGGTTGLSKGAIATHGRLVANTLQIKSWFLDMREGQEVTLMAIPLYHVYGMLAGMAFAMTCAASLVMVPDPRVLKDVLGNIHKYHPTTFSRLCRRCTTPSTIIPTSKPAASISTRSARASPARRRCCTKPRWRSSADRRQSV